MSPSRSVSLGWPTQKVKKQPSELTRRVHTPIGYQPTYNTVSVVISSSLREEDLCLKFTAFIQPLLAKREVTGSLTIK